MRAVLTPEDLKKGELTDPGWYLSKIHGYEEKVTKGTPEKPSDGSTNAVFTFELLEGSKGKKIDRYFNEKALGFGKNLYKALEFPLNAGGGYDLSTELFQQTVGSYVVVYIKRGQGTKGPFDEIADFRKPTEAELKKVLAA